MCKCRPEVRTPYCGRVGCEWPGRRPAGARKPDLQSTALNVWVEEANNLRQQVAQMKEELERLRGALQEIAVGKLAEDDEHPLGPWASMAGRFLTVAQAALAAGKE